MVLLAVNMEYIMYTSNVYSKTKQMLNVALSTK